MAINFEDIAQKRSEPLGEYTCTFLWEDGNGFCAVMNDLPDEVYIDSHGKRMWFIQSKEDKKVYLYKGEEYLTKPLPTYLS